MERRIISKKGFSFDPLNYYMTDAETSRVYGRVIGGIAWPSEKPGSIVVLAQELGMRTPPPVPDIFVLEVVSAVSLPKLIHEAVQLQNMFSVSEFYSNTENFGAMNYLSHWNDRARAQRSRTLRVLKAPHLKGNWISFHINAVVSALDEANKVLHFGPFNQLAAELAGIPASAVSQVKDAEYPLIAALGFATVELTSNPYILGEGREAGQAKTDYDVLNWNVKRPYRGHGRLTAGRARTEYDIFNYNKQRRKS